jgi:hypothetical protein
MDDDKAKYAGKPGYDENGEIDWEYLKTDRAQLMPVYMIVKMPVWLVAAVNIEARESDMTAVNLVNQILSLAVMNLQRDRITGGYDKVVFEKMVKNSHREKTVTCWPDSEYSAEERELEKIDSVKWLHQERNNGK